MMKKKYIYLQVIAGCYLVIYITALYFATGIGIGFKLDDNQLIGYFFCGILLGCLCGSFWATTIKFKRLFSVLMAGFCLTLLGITIFNFVSFNETFWYFVLFVYLIPVVDLIETVTFVLGSLYEEKHR